MPKQIIANGQLMEVPDTTLCCIPQPGVNLKPALGYFEINGRTTLDCCDELAEDKAKHILTGPLFAHFFRKLFEEPFPIPQSRQELDDAADDVRHTTGLIILLFEALCERGEKVFIKNPETHLHPAQARCLMCLINDFLRMGKGPITTTLEPEPQ